MKGNVPPAAIAAIVVLVLILIGAFYMKGAAGESTAPKPDPSRFLAPGKVSPKTP